MKARIVSILGTIVFLSIHQARPASGQSCTPPTLAQCTSYAWITSPCGIAEWNARHLDPTWICHTPIANQVNAAPSRVTVEPREIYDFQTGTPQTRPYGTRTVKVAPFNSNGMYMFDGPTPPAGFTDRFRYSLNGQAFANCKEMAYESFGRFSDWYDDNRFKSFQQAFSAAYSGPLALVNAQDQSIMLDTAGQQLPAVPWRPIPTTALQLWDRAQQRPKTNVARVTPSFAWHRQRNAEAVSNGWSEDQLDYLGQLQAELASYVGVWARLELQAAELTNLDLMLQFGPGNTKFDTNVGVTRRQFLVTLSRALASRYDEGAGALVHAGKWLPQGRWFSSGSYYTAEGGGLIGRPGLTNPIDGVVDPWWESFGGSAPSNVWNDSYTGLAQNAGIQADLAAIAAAQNTLVVEINRRFDFLAPICQTTPSPCAWSPRLFREQVEQFYLSSLLIWGRGDSSAGPGVG